MKMGVETTMIMYHIRIAFQPLALRHTVIQKYTLCISINVQCIHNTARSTFMQKTAACCYERSSYESTYASSMYTQSDIHHICTQYLLLQCSTVHWASGTSHPVSFITAYVSSGNHTRFSIYWIELRSELLVL